MQKRSNKRLRLRGIVAFSLSFIVFLSVAAVYVEIRLNTIAVTFARNTLSSVLSTAVDTAAVSLLKKYSVTYDKLSVINRDADNKVTSVEINSTEVNQFKNGLSRAVQEELNKTSEITVNVPLSAAFGLYYTYLSFPKISYTISAATVISANIKSEFVDAGINQVLHRISVRVSTAGNLGLVGKDEKVEGISDFTVAETVIVGDVPDAYTRIDYADEKVVGDVFDYGAQLKD